jgi:hypothetical protein
MIQWCIKKYSVETGGIFNLHPSRLLEAEPLSLAALQVPAIFVGTKRRSKSGKAKNVFRISS